MTGQNGIRVLLADDHPITREGIRQGLERTEDILVVGEAANGADCARLHQLLAPHVTLLDLQMPGTDGLYAIGEIRRTSPAAIIVVLTTFDGDGRVTKALSLGAMSYLLKTSALTEIIQAIRDAMRGHGIVASRLLSCSNGLGYRGNLTASEVEVLRLVAQGKSNRLIGQELFISEETVKSRVSQILGKLGANDRAHAVRIGMERGFL